MTVHDLLNGSPGDPVSLAVEKESFGMGPDEQRARFPEVAVEIC